MRELLRDAFTFIVTMLTAGGAYVAGHYDKISATALSVSGLAFLAWRWRKSSKTQLCDAKNCIHRHDPTEN